MTSFLQYVEMSSPLHRLNQTSKFLFFIVMSVLTSFLQSGIALVFLLVFFLTLWGSCGLIKYLLMLLGKLKAFLLFIFFLWLVLGAFKENSGPVILRHVFHFSTLSVIISLEWYDMYKGAFYACRVFLMIATFYTVILTTNFSQIIQGLTRWKVPYPVSFGIGLVFQIIPMVIQEFDSIREAQSSRGLEVEKCGTATKVKNLVVLAGPLMFRILGKGHFISLAMHYYKLDFGKYRSSFKQTPFGRGDGFFIALTAASVGIVLFLQYRYVL